MDLHHLPLPRRERSDLHDHSAHRRSLRQATLKLLSEMLRLTGYYLLPGNAKTGGKFTHVVFLGAEVDIDTTTKGRRPDDKDALEGLREAVSRQGG